VYSFVHLLHKKLILKVLNTTSASGVVKLPDVDLRIRIGDNWFLDDEILRHESKKGYVTGQVESIR
jgi:hypothetical protein